MTKRKRQGFHCLRRKVSYLGLKNSLLFAVLFLREMRTKIWSPWLSCPQRDNKSDSHISPGLRGGGRKRLSLFFLRLPLGRAPGGAWSGTVFPTAPPNEQVDRPDFVRPSSQLLFPRRWWLCLTLSKQLRCMQLYSWQGLLQPFISAFFFFFLAPSLSLLWPGSHLRPKQLHSNQKNKVREASTVLSLKTITTWNTRPTWLPRRTTG